MDALDHFARVSVGADAWNLSFYNLQERVKNMNFRQKKTLGYVGFYGEILDSLDHFARVSAGILCSELVILQEER